MDKQSHSSETKKNVLSPERVKRKAFRTLSGVAIGLTLAGFPQETSATPLDRQKITYPNKDHGLEKVRSHRIGIGLHFNCLPMSSDRRLRAFEAMRDNKIGWARINLNWNDLEPVQGVRDPDVMADLDDCIGQANRSSIRPLVVFQGSPEWANGGKDWNTPPINPDDYASALGYLAERYKGTVKAWEIWNEPNFDSFWTGTPQQMTGLMKAAYPAVKKADPRAYVLLPGLAQNDAGYLKELYKSGAKDYFDVVSTHVYTRVPPQTPYKKAGNVSIAGVQGVINIMKQFGDTKKPVWLTEFGWPVSRSLNEEGQAVLIEQAIKLLQTIKEVKAAFYFQVEDAGSGDTWEKSVALIDEDKHIRPGLQVLGRAALGRLK